jgi:hypothetical protein
MRAAGIEERPSALHAAFAAALFITSVAAFLRFLFVAFNDVLDIMNVYRAAEHHVYEYCIYRLITVL